MKSFDAINLDYHRTLLDFVKEGLKEVLDRKEGFPEDYKIISFKLCGKDYADYFLREGSLWKQDYTKVEGASGLHPRTRSEKISLIESLTLEDITPNAVLIAAERVNKLLRETS